jgi:hypothetical protein
MTPERVIRILAATIVLVSLALARSVSAWFLLGTAFVGFNLLQSGITRLRPAGVLLRRFGLRSCSTPVREHTEVG